MKTKKVTTESMPLSCGFCAKVTGMDIRLMNMRINTYNAFLVCVILSIFMLFPGINIYAAPEDEGYKDGYTYGLLDGILSGTDDVNSGNRRYYTKVSSDADIRSTYSLDKESSEYRRDFLQGYKVGYREGYTRGYDNPNNGGEINTVDYAVTLGILMGEINGRIDFYKDKENRWANSVPTTSKIIELFDLMKEPNDYKNNFISNFKTNFKVGYEKGYSDAKFKPFSSAIDQGNNDGKHFGGILGANYGRKDYYSNLESNWHKDLFSDSEIESIFLLNNDLDDYSKAFLGSFKRYYREKYEEAYRLANADYNKLLFENGYSQGKDIGAVKGESFARIDLLLGRDNNIVRHIFSDQDVIREYKLYNEDEKYRDGFISGYNEGFRSGYISTYQESNYQDYVDKVKTKIIPISGGEALSGDKRMTFTSEKGTYYNDIVVSIDRLLQNNAIKMPSMDRYTKASDLYSIRIANPSESLDRDKSIKLSFEYYGNKNAGIYKYSNNSWIYLPSNMNENSITTAINPKSMNNKTDIYAVFIDNNAWNPDDIRGNWAKDELITFLRRGILDSYSDNAIRPNSSITGEQLLTYINKVFKKDLKPSDLGATIENIIKMNGPITYREVEVIMKKAMNDNNFIWKSIADKIIRNKDRYTLSFKSMDNYITRAEAIYMLYYLTE